MIKFKINSLVIALVLLVPCLAFALPGAHDPASGNAFTCNSCHFNPATYGNTDANFGSNVCMRCHLTTGAAIPGKTAKTFNPEDFANPFNTVNTAVLSRGSALQTSHKWFGSDTVPAAGAVAPIDTALANGLNKNSSFSGTLFCARCHNVHGTSGTTSNYSPYLRYPNDSDQLCLNCHRPRDTKDHTLGTHPVNVSYTSASVKAKITSGSLLAAPVTNATNPTGQTKLIGNKVVCSTCHKTHNADSRTSTFDPYSSGQAFGQLSSSKGYLLRVDAYGKTVNDVNICTNCHAGKKNHNLTSRGGKAPSQCNDCHSGHVEYDPTVVVAEKTPNVYLVRRFLQYSTAGRISKRILYRSTTTKEYYNANGNGVCQSCHNPPADHYVGSVLTGSFPEGGHSDCASCHNHTEATGAFSVGAGGCTSCHGQPPTTKAAGGPTGKASGYTTFNEYSTPHASHAGGTQYNYTCSECHSGNTHNSGATFTDVFKSTAGIKAGGTATYASPTCSNVYCHSSGKTVLSFKGGVNTVAWGNNKGSIIGQGTECNTCHDTSTYSATHAKHITTMAYGCVTCHAGTVSNNTTLLAAAKLSGGTHVNGTKDVLFSGAPPATGASCAVVACHSNGKGAAPIITPDWANAASGACGACHATTPSIGGTLFLNSNAHFTHMSTTYGPKVGNTTVAACQQCHTTYTTESGPTHVDGTIQKITTCTPCHPSGTTYTWTSATRLGCTDCHSATPSVINSVSAPYKQYFTTSGHGQVDANHTASASCTACHDGSKKHIDGVLGSAEKRIIGVNDNTHCNGCHNNSVKVPTVSRRNMVTHVTAHNSGATSDCKSCHDVHGTTNYAQIKTLLNGATISFAASGANYINGTNNGLCQTCHTVTNHFRRLTDETLNTAKGYVTAGGTDHTAFNSATNCLSCHTHSGGSYAFYPSGGACDSCHGYPPVRVIGNGIAGRQGLWSSAKLQNYTGGAGVHNITGHIPASAKATNGWNADCNKCHYNTAHSMDTTKFTTPGLTEQARKANVNVVVSPTYKFNTNFSLDQNRYDNSKVTPNNTGKCSNVSCHFQASPRWSTER